MHGKEFFHPITLELMRRLWGARPEIREWSVKHKAGKTYQTKSPGMCLILLANEGD